MQNYSSPIFNKLLSQCKDLVNDTAIGPKSPFNSSFTIFQHFLLRHL